MPQDSGTEVLADVRARHASPMPDGGPSDGARPVRRGPAHAAPDRFTWRDAMVWCVLPVLLVLLVRVFLFGFYEIPSRSMESTIEPGDRVITTKLVPDVFAAERGDVVVFHDPADWLANESSGSVLGGDYLIKRLIGLPGDVVECDGPGEPVRVNGVALDESAYLKDGVQPSAFAFRVEVTEGHVFVMGDNRANSADSRYHQNDGDHGLVPLDKVVGKALCRYWPLTRVSSLEAHHEVFADVPDVDASRFGSGETA